MAAVTDKLVTVNLTNLYSQQIIFFCVVFNYGGY